MADVLPDELEDRFPWRGAPPDAVERALLGVGRKIVSSGARVVGFVPVTPLRMTSLLARLGLALTRLRREPVLFIERWHDWSGEAAPGGEPESAVAAELVAPQLHRVLPRPVATRADARLRLHRTLRLLPSAPAIILVDASDIVVRSASEGAIPDWFDATTFVGRAFRTPPRLIRALGQGLPERRNLGLLLVGAETRA